ncbi:hypothetical protein K469DRAFT_687686 [Zopfia rhizophila CBS 207.26]|uniref:Uncharacterized protein n=1 Tax=Zopfia rhizophila CBS 207.26 TaxID=1314779 RepID=A0A6A6E5R6_9PEZI|nr:hypothetical protein K469DRAFT_687686 [Zopfia rhizophila CBS 207.26]
MFEDRDGSWYASWNLKDNPGQPISVKTGESVYCILIAYSPEEYIGGGETYQCLVLRKVEDREGVFERIGIMNMIVYTPVPEAEDHLNAERRILEPSKVLEKFELTTVKII